jgi:integrase
MADQNHSLPFSVVAEAYLRRYAEHHQKPRTLTETRRYVRLYLKPAWRDRPVSDIRRADVFAVLDAMVDRGIGTSANRCLATARRLFNWCVERGYLERSPAAGIRPLVRERPRERVLSMNELSAVWRAAASLGFPTGTWVQVMIATGGQRVRDVVTMRRASLELDTWRIETPTKSEKPHVVPLSTLAQALLESCPALTGPYVFSTTDGLKHIQSLSKIKCRLDDRSGVTNWRYHDIRRTVATCFGDDLELSPHVAEAVQNRRSGVVSGVVAVYNRAHFESLKREALQLWADRLAAAVNHRPPELFG